MRAHWRWLAWFGCLSACSSADGGSTPVEGDDTSVVVTDDAASETSTPVDTSAPGDDTSAPLPDTATPIDTGTVVDVPAGAVDPPFGGSSKGSGGAAPVGGTVMMASGITYRLIVPSAPKKPAPLLVVYSGTEGGATMTTNLQSLSPTAKTTDFIFAVLDGKTYFGDGKAGETVLLDVRSKYDVDNDRTYLLGESAGTSAALKLGFHLRQSWFAAYWANDVNASDTPAKNASELGFAPHGQAGPGGALAIATDIVTKMKAAGYRVPVPAPYDGPGSTTHGAPQQFIAAVSWFPGKTRK